VDTYGKNNGYTLILDSKAGVIYFSDGVDITDQLVKELDAAMAVN
ncbi:MAG: OmpH family outer membrane protein, partial [Desulfobulbaceae bacterium]